MDRPEKRLALIELLERDGRLRRCVEVEAWPVTLGRSLDCDVVLEDPHVAARHVRIASSEEGLQLEVGATRNGVQLGHHTLAEGQHAPLPRAAVWQIGATRVRVRLPDDPIEAERPLGLAVTGARPLVTLLCALALWALVLIEHGIGLDPGARFTDWLVPLLGAPAVVALWCLLWGIGSKLFQHRFEFWPHFAVLVKGVLVMGVLELVLPVLGYSLSWEWLSRIAPGVAVAAGVATLFGHAVLVVPLDRRVLAAGIGGCFLIGAAVLMTMNHQRTDRLFGEPYLATLPPPALRLAPPVSVGTFIAESAALRARLDRRAGQDERDDMDADDD